MVKKLVPIYLSGIFLSLHYAAILYVNSSYLAQFFSESQVSLLFLIGALGNILFFISASWLVRKAGARTLFALFLLGLALSTLLLAAASSKALAAAAFIAYSSVLFMAYWTLDLFLEAASTDARTGSIRGSFLTSINAAIAAAPLLLAIFSIGEDFRLLYYLACLLLLPPIVLAFMLSPIRGGSQRSPLPEFSLRAWWERVSVRKVTIARFLLEFFYTFMIIYTPVYLNQHLGFEWSELGIIFTIMLLPFVLLEWPMGAIADRWLGEKEIMSAGFLIAAAALVLMPLIGKEFYPWMAILFFSRVGASMIEVSTESYFFKHINVGEPGTIGAFRLGRPLAVIAAALLGALYLSFFEYKYIFWALAGFILLGLTQSLRLRDTK